MSASTLPNSPIDVDQPPVAENSSSRGWRIARLGFCLTALWLSPLGFAAAAYLHMPDLFWQACACVTGYSLLAGLGVLMATWTIGGPGFLLVRAITAIGVGLFVAWHSMQILAAAAKLANRAFAFNAAIVASAAVWLLISYGAGIALLSVRRAWGWQLADESRWKPSYELSAVDWALALGSCALALTVVTPVIWMTADYESLRRWTDGAVDASFLAMVAGVPTLIVILLALSCEGATAATIGIVASWVAMLTTLLAIFVMLSRPFLGPPTALIFSIIPAAVVLHLFVVMGTALMRLAFHGQDDDVPSKCR